VNADGTRPHSRGIPALRHEPNFAGPGIKAAPGVPGYVASKWAIRGLTNDAALDRWTAITLLLSNAATPVAGRVSFQV
jgi:hypothetical protein